MIETPQYTLKEHIISFRLTAEQVARIGEAAKALKNPRTRADYCRAAALFQAKQQVPGPVIPLRRPSRRLPARDTQLLCQILGQLGKIGSNINQITKLANSMASVPETKILHEIRTAVLAAKTSVVAALAGGGDANGD